MLPVQGFGHLASPLLQLGVTRWPAARFSLGIYLSEGFIPPASTRASSLRLPDVAFLPQVSSHGLCHDASLKEFADELKGFVAVIALQSFKEPRNPVVSCESAVPPRGLCPRHVVQQNRTPS